MTYNDGDTHKFALKRRELVKTVGASVSSYAERSYVQGQLLVPLTYIWRSSKSQVLGHTISPELAQVAAVLERLIEHQQSKILALLVLQKPIRLPLEDRVHGEMLPMRE